MNIQLESIFSSTIDYVSSLPQEMLAGNVFAVSSVLIFAYITILLINKLTGLLIFVLKKVILAVIISLAFYMFLQGLYLKVLTEGFTTDLIILGVAGTLIGFLALFISLYAAFSSVKVARRKKQKVEVKSGITKSADLKTTSEITEKTGEIETTIKTQTTGEVKDRNFGEMLSMQSITNDKTLGAVLAYLIVAQFGVFSSKTIAAPTAEVGLGFFIAFMIAALFFIQHSYKDYKKGVFHLAAAFVVGIILSIILGHYWGNYPVEQLLSIAYFSTDSLVAFVTGLALSLFMGSKS